MKAIDIPFAAVPAEGVLSGGQPSDPQFRAAREAGYQTVINMRDFGEPGVAEAAKALPEMGFTYHHLPVAGPMGITVENAKAFARLLDEAEKPVLVHCGSGNRVGALAAMAAFHVDGKSADEAMAIGKAWGMTGLAPMVQGQLER